MISLAEPQLETTLHPMSMNQYLPANFEATVTFNCSVSADLTVVWSIDGTQILHDLQFNSSMDDGYAIEPKNTHSTFSTMTVSVNKSTLIECLPFMNLIRQCQDCTQEVYNIVTFGKYNWYYNY